MRANSGAQFVIGSSRSTPFLVQHQRHDRRHGLGHRRDAEDRVALDRQLGPQITPPDCGDLCDTSVTPDQGRSSGQFSSLDASIERLLYRIFHSVLVLKY
jgi:hypothetical protein